MMDRLRGAGLVPPTLAMLTALGLLIGLGTWQLQRMVWKERLVRDIVARTRADPVSVDDVLRRLRQTADAEYTRVRVTGRFLHEDERYFYAPDSRLGPGYHVVTPLVVRTGANCQDIVLINRGYVTEAVKEPAKRGEGQINPPVVAVEGTQASSRLARGATVTGLVRLPETPGWFTPANDPARNLWFWRDPAALAASLKAAGPAQACAPGARPYPFLVDAQAEPANPGGWPRGGTTRLELPNRHFEYALTWFGLAATLIGVYTAFAAGRLKGRDDDSRHSPDTSAFSDHTSGSG